MTSDLDTLMDRLSALDHTDPASWKDKDIDAVNLEYIVSLLEQATPNGECLECHLNPGALYPKISATEYAHRFVCSTVHGELTNGLQALHSCDNTRCIRPKHLFIGTQQDNVDDMIAKGRVGKVGGQRPRWFPPEDIAKMVAMSKDRYSQREIAKEFNTSQKTVWRYLQEASLG